MILRNIFLAIMLGMFLYIALVAMAISVHGQTAAIAYPDITAQYSTCGNLQTTICGTDLQGTPQPNP